MKILEQPTPDKCFCCERGGFGAGGIGAVWASGAMSADAERDAADAAKWAARWHEFEREAIDLAGAMTDPDARRHMLFIAESYRLLAERAKERSERLARLASHMKKR